MDREYLPHKILALSTLLLKDMLNATLVLVGYKQRQIAPIPQDVYREMKFFAKHTMMKLVRRVADAHEKKLTGHLADEGSPMSHVVHFDLVDRANMIFTVKGCQGSYDTTYSDPPAPLVKDSKVTLVKGKFPLHDYKDTSNYAKHEYTFRLPDETTLTGILDGFTYDCTDQSTCNYGIPQISVQIPSATLSRPESPSPQSPSVADILASD